MQIREKTRPNRLIDTIASNNGYGQNNALSKLTDRQTDRLSYPKSRDAIASKNHFLSLPLRLDKLLDVNV